MENKGTETLETDRLILRRFTVEDAKPMYENWAKDPEVTRYLTWQHHVNENVTRGLIELWISQYEDKACYNWAIELKEEGEVIGNISAEKIDETYQSASLGYCMSKKWWGRGIMPEALKAVIKYFFEEVGLNRIAASHDVRNQKSGRVMEKAGMKTEGTLRDAAINTQGICDITIHSILKREYFSEKNQKEQAKN